MGFDPYAVIDRNPHFFLDNSYEPENAARRDPTYRPLIRILLRFVILSVASQITLAAPRPQGNKLQPTLVLRGSDNRPVGMGFGIRDGSGVMFISHVGEVYASGFLPLVARNVRKGRLAKFRSFTPMNLGMDASPP